MYVERERERSRCIPDISCAVMPVMLNLMLFGCYSCYILADSCNPQKNPKRKNNFLIFCRILQVCNVYPMTDPWCWYINANIKGVKLMLNVTIYSSTMDPSWVCATCSAIEIINPLTYPIIARYPLPRNGSLCRFSAMSGHRLKGLASCGRSEWIPLDKVIWLAMNLGKL